MTAHCFAYCLHALAQFVREFAKLGLTRTVGGVLGLALARELTPVVTSIILAGAPASADARTPCMRGSFLLRPFLSFLAPASISAWRGRVGARPSSPPSSSPKRRLRPRTFARHA